MPWETPAVLQNLFFRQPTNPISLLLLQDNEVNACGQSAGFYLVAWLPGLAEDEATDRVGDGERTGDGDAEG